MKKTSEKRLYVLHSPLKKWASKRTSTFTILYRKVTIPEKISFSLLWSLSFKLVNFLVEKKNHYTHIVLMLEGNFFAPFRFTLKPDVELQTHRPTKTLFHHSEKLNEFLNELQKIGIIKQIGSKPQENSNFRAICMNLLIPIKTKDSYKNDLIARHLNSKTDQPPESWPLEPSATQLARAKHQ